jgi:hypothetical protein
MQSLKAQYVPSMQRNKNYNGHLIVYDSHTGDRIRDYQCPVCKKIVAFRDKTKVKTKGKTFHGRCFNSLLR